MTDDERDEQFYRDTEAVAFPKLDDRQLSLLEPLGQRRVLKRGDVVLKAGQRDFGLTIVLRGEIEAFEQRDGEEQILATPHERDFLGDVSMLQGTSALANARVSYAVRPGVELFVRGANLFGQRYEDVFGYRTEPRTGYIGVRLADRRSSP